MNIKSKLLLGAVLLTAVPTSIVGIVSAWTAGADSRAAMHQQVENNLVAVRDTKRKQIEMYFQRMHKQVQVLSASPVVSRAIEDFKIALNWLKRDQAEQQRQALGDYYNNQYGRVYTEKNPGSSIDSNGLLGAIDDTAAVLQSLYIQENSHPLGSKHLLDAAADGSGYSKVHAGVHPYFRRYLEQFGYYDIFLVEPEQGRVVYSVFKEVDFGTSLLNGPYANSGLGEAFRAATALNDPSGVVQTDYAVYRPSYDDQAAFIASPIVADGKTKGVLVFQIPIAEINDVMTSGGEWQKVGLGQTGETYLVGPDRTLRSASRSQIEDPQAYLAALRAAGVTGSVLEHIETFGSGVGLQPVDTLGANEALQGKSGFAIFDDYRGGTVLSAYAPLDIHGLEWGILSEIDRDEAFAPAEAMVADIALQTGILVTVIIALGVGVGIWFANSLSRPLAYLTGEIKSIAEHSDLTRQLALERKDELGDIADALNGMFVQFREALKLISHSSEQLSSASTELSVTTGQTRSVTAQQQAEADQMATAVEQMAATATEVAQSAGSASAGADEANSAVEEGRGLVSATHATIAELANEVASVNEVVARLKGDSEAIGGVLDVIRSVAEQTNLLALNAAIEAARAGEQGRGFAVVADEVRTLASRTQSSTEEIQQMIERVQTGADRAARGMTQSREQAERSVTQSNEADMALTRISEAIKRMNDMNHQIASAAEEQSSVSAEVSSSVHSIARASAETNASANQIAQSSEALNQVAVGLHDLVERFKT